MVTRPLCLTDPAVQARQGDAILAWYADGDYVPQYTDGIRLFFTPEDLVYGQWDMHETLPDTYWHYYYQSYPPGDPYYPGVLFPSCAGLSAKFVETIEIYSTPVGGWNLVVDGTDIGGLNQTISKNYFEQALACQFGANHGVEYTDSQGRVWGGMPLWFLCGFVDDADMHSDHAYNETLASMGYNIVITADDGYSQVFDSRGTIRNNNYIIANTLNGTPFPEDDSNWPLRLVGVNVSGSQSVRGIASIILTSASPAVDFIGTPQYGTIPLTVQFQGLSGTSAADWWIWEFGDGLVSYDASPVHTYQNAGIYTVTLTAGNAAGSGTETKIDYIVAALPPNPGSGGNEGDGETYSEPTPEVTQAPAGEPTPTPVSTQPIITPTVTQTVTATKGTGETEVVPTTASPLIYAPLLLVGTLPFLKRKK
jgi:PKD repeat protein